uniref:Secreted protein n=1 Tax=Steinernema glaseri TaxID=37863 RepID=A0A1I7Z1G4_9BILA
MLFQGVLALFLPWSSSATVVRVRRCEDQRVGKSSAANSCSSKDWFRVQRTAREGSFLDCKMVLLDQTL